MDAIEYHQRTKHFPEFVRHDTYRLNWAIQPNPFKDYVGLQSVPLPSPTMPTGYPATLAVTERPAEARVLDAPEVSRLLNLAAGVSRIYELPGGEQIFFRTYACAGALYPIEVYLACGGEVEGLSPGLYHFHPLESALRQLRTDDPRPYLARATGLRRSVATSPVSMILTGIPWRTTWKYRARGYRHLYWDSGMILANMLALAASGGHPAEVLLGFDDQELNLLVGVDGDREMAICVVPVGLAGPGTAPVEPSGEPPQRIPHRAVPLSEAEVSYPEIGAVHQKSSLAAPEAAGNWSRSHERPPNTTLRDLCSESSIEGVILRRGSKRAFKHSPIPLDQLEGIIDHATYRLSCDWGGPLIQVALIANAVEGLEPGAYTYAHGFELVSSGKLRDKARFLCLDQPLGGDAAATLFLLADLNATLRALGDRGYRAAQLEAGIIAGRVYLAAYACGLGATGLTFYDDEVRAFFQTEAEPMMTVAIGR
ncbi:MAG TPA: SagB/ThcOx family dehydrogenase [Actinomycetota bacterium]|nr:SagB/ThcOx family dehydrogenase [Actinomycetota bacterium]